MIPGCFEYIPQHFRYLSPNQNLKLLPHYLFQEEYFWQPNRDEQTKRPTFSNVHPFKGFYF